MARKRWDAVVVGAGPNGLAAAITIAAAGRSVLLREAKGEVGGACRSAALTRPGFVHDPCSAAHPFAAASPFLRSLPLARYGLEWVHPEVPVAHPLDGGTAALLHRSLEETAAGLGDDGPAWRRLFGPIVEAWEAIFADVVGLEVWPPRRPGRLLRFGLDALWPATRLARARFVTPGARALFAGLAAHAFRPLDRPGTAAFGLLLGAAGHAVGWPFPKGGAGRLTEAMAAYLLSLGGEIEVDAPVRSLDALPPARAILLDLTPRQVLAVGGDRLPARYARTLARFRYGPAAFKVDYALDGPVPWAVPGCARAGTLHLGGTLGELAAAEAAPHQGRIAERPYVLVVQPSRFDPTRAPEGRHTLWAYCHVPQASTESALTQLEAQLERFAPGFSKRVLARAVRTPADLERDNANLVGGDISGGATDLLQLFRRPAVRLPPWSTPVPGLWLCSSSTPPGPGVHGLPGHLAARAALHRDPRKSAA